MNHIFHNSGVDREITARNLPMHEAFKLVSEKAIVCKCGRFPSFRDMPTITGRSMHFLECNCGEAGVVAYDGEMYSEKFVGAAIDGWNNRVGLKERGVTEVSIIY
jgi:hypothetical protein